MEDKVRLGILIFLFYLVNELRYGIKLNFFIIYYFFDKFLNFNKGIVLLRINMFFLIIGRNGLFNIFIEYVLL